VKFPHNRVTVKVGKPDQNFCRFNTSRKSIWLNKQDFFRFRNLANLPFAFYTKAEFARFFMLKTTITILLFVIFAFIFQGCKNESPKIDSVNQREITDDLGRKISLPSKIERAVSLAPNLTETVFAIDAGDKLVGVTTYCNFPEQAKSIQKIGDTMKPNIENIIALKPQIVLVSTASQIEAFTKTLEQQNIAVFITNPNSLESIYKTIKQLGEIFGKDEKAKTLVESLQKRVAEIESKTKSANRIKIFVQIDKNSIFTIGKTSYITDLINRAGGISATADIENPYPNLSKETALALQPEAIILSESEDNKEPNDAFANSPAVKNGKVFKIDADILSRPSPRVVDALEQIAKDLHPELF
jgi:iron complex transport system substrate-binding protein